MLVFMRGVDAVEFIVVRDKAALAKEAGSFILAHAVETPNLNIMAGHDPDTEAVLDYLAQESHPESGSPRTAADTREALAYMTIFNMAELCRHNSAGGWEILPPDDPGSNRNSLLKDKFRHVSGISNFFPGSDNANHYIGHYDESIGYSDGIDICINAIGSDGRTFGFNQPGSSLRSRTRVVRLNQTARQDYADRYGEDMPVNAITAGMATGMAARHILMVSSGLEIAPAVERAITGDVSKEFPASKLRDHESLTWMVDEAAASRLG
jgi:6-phosphogluconolactonase/glucosamine-6-phosphate isomerase/deaminase